MSKRPALCALAVVLSVAACGRNEPAPPLVLGPLEAIPLAWRRRYVDRRPSRLDLQPIVPHQAAYRFFVPQRPHHTAYRFCVVKVVNTPSAADRPARMSTGRGRCRGGERYRGSDLRRVLASG